MDQQYNKKSISSLNNQRSYSSIDHHIYSNTYRQPHELALKLKHIRTRLGYHLDLPPSPTLSKIPENADKKEEKGQGLKNFILSMRKRRQSELVALSHRPEYNLASTQNQGVKEYSEAALKYIHSFLPHQSTIQTERKRKANSSYHTLDPSRINEVKSSRDPSFQVKKRQSAQLSPLVQELSSCIRAVGSEEGPPQLGKSQSIGKFQNIEIDLSSLNIQDSSTRSISLARAQHPFSKQSLDILYRARHHLPRSNRSKLLSNRQAEKQRNPLKSVLPSIVPWKSRDK